MSAGNWSGEICAGLIAIVLGCSAPSEQAAQPPTGGAGGTVGANSANAGTGGAAAGAAGTMAGGAAGESTGEGGAAGSVDAVGGAGGEGGSTSLTPGSGGAAGAAGAMASCELTPAAQTDSATPQQFDIELTFDDMPFQRGDVVTVGDSEVSLTTFLFFLSQAALIQGDEEIPVDLVGTDAAIEPYGVHLFDLETPGSYSFRINAPAGQYDGLKLAVGLAPACNGGNPADRMAPLNASSPMNWTWGFGYMFLRLEGTTTTTANPEPAPLHIHGGALGAMGTTGEALLSIPGTFSPINEPIVLRMDLRPVLELAVTNTDHLVGGRVMLDALPTLDFLAFTTAIFVEPFP